MDSGWGTYWASASRVPGAGAIGWDPISIFGLAPVLIIVTVFLTGFVTVFLAGFLWESRRISR